MGSRAPVGVWAAAVFLSLGLGFARAEGLMPADLVVTDARIYSARPQPGMAHALGIKNGTIVYAHLDEVLKAPQRVTERLNSAGITGMLDAMAAPEGLPVYDMLLARQDISSSPTKVARTIFETPMCSRLGSWASGFTLVTLAKQMRREV